MTTPSIVQQFTDTTISSPSNTCIPGSPVTKGNLIEIWATVIHGPSIGTITVTSPGYTFLPIPNTLSQTADLQVYLGAFWAIVPANGSPTFTCTNSDGAQILCSGSEISGLQFPGNPIVQSLGVAGTSSNAVCTLPRATTLGNLLTVASGNRNGGVSAPTINVGSLTPGIADGFVPTFINTGYWQIAHGVSESATQVGGSPATGSTCGVVEYAAARSDANFFGPD